MVQLAKPDGWVANLEPGGEYALCYPEHPVYTWIRELFGAAFSRHGAARLIPLAELYRHAGLRGIGIETSLGP